MLFILAAILGVLILDLKELKKNNFKNLSVYFLIMFFSLTIGILLSLDIRPLSPAEVIGGILRGVHLLK
jgi:hypothetical protein